MTNSEAYANTFSLTGAIANAKDSAKQFSTRCVVYKNKETGRYFDSQAHIWRNYQSENPRLEYLGAVDANLNWNPKATR